MKAARPLAAGWLLVLLAGASEPGQAVPRYAARYGQRCALCHVDPSGGGQRTLYAAQYLVPAELAAGWLAPEEIAANDPSLGKNLTAGFDLRTIYHRSDPARPGVDNFLQMQGAVHLTFQLSSRMAAYVSRGQSQTTEAFGVAHVLPWDGHVKIGRFTPAYGWRFADHTQYTREILGWSAPGQSDVGIEASLNPGRWTASASVTNGNRGSIADNNQQAGYAGQLLYRANFSGVGLGAGGSIWRNSDPSGRRLDRGPFGYVAVGPFIWLGEAGWSTLDPGRSAAERTAWLTSQELTVRLRRGLELRGTYDFFDPDLDLKSGSRDRVGAGVEFLPYPFLALHGMVRREEFVGAARGSTPAPEVDQPDRDWFELQVHVLF